MKYPWCRPRHAEDILYWKWDKSRHSQASSPLLQFDASYLAHRRTQWDHGQLSKHLPQELTTKSILQETVFGAGYCVPALVKSSLEYSLCKNLLIFNHRCLVLIWTESTRRCLAVSLLIYLRRGLLISTVVQLGYYSSSSISPSLLVAFYTALLDPLGPFPVPPSSSRALEPHLPLSAQSRRR